MWTEIFKRNSLVFWRTSIMTKARHDNSFRDAEDRRLCAHVAYFLDDSEGSLWRASLPTGRRSPWEVRGRDAVLGYTRQIGHSRALYKRNKAGEISQHWLWTRYFQILSHFGAGEVQGLLSAEQMLLVPCCPLLHHSFLQGTESRRSHIPSEKHISFFGW